MRVVSHDLGQVWQEYGKRAILGKLQLDAGVSGRACPCSLRLNSPCALIATCLLL